MTNLPSKSKKRILVIEDDRESRFMITAALAFADCYDVEVSEDRDNALDMIKQKNIDVVLLDLYMAGKSAPEFLTEMAKPPRSRVILVSGCKMIEKEAAALGIEHYIGKPFQYERLLALVAKCLAE